MQKKSLKCVDLSYNIAKIGGSHYKYASCPFSQPEALDLAHEVVFVVIANTGIAWPRWPIGCEAVAVPTTWRPSCSVVMVRVAWSTPCLGIPIDKCVGFLLMMRWIGCAMQARATASDPTFPNRSWPSARTSQSPNSTFRATRSATLYCFPLHTHAICCQAHSHLPCAGCVRLLRAQGLMKVFDNLRANTALTWIAFDNNGAALGSLQALKNCVANGNQSLLSTRPLPSPALCNRCTHSSCLPLPPKRCVFRATM